jgi:hypothetical protein
VKRARGTGTRPFGLSGSFKRAAQGLVLAGVVMVMTGIFAQAALAATGNQQPILTATRATFNIKATNPSNRVWELSLWELSTGPQKFLGEDTGTSGLLLVHVPATAGCDFQVDVSRNGAFYSGFKRYVAFCGGVSVSSTSSTATTSQSTTSSIPVSTVPVTKPKTKTSGGHTTTTVAPATKGGGSGGSGTPPTPVPSGKLAFTGAGTALTLLAILGALLLLSGVGLLVYARRYPRMIP